MNRSDSGDSGTPAAWFSKDGQSWARVPLAPGVEAPDAGWPCHHEVIAFENGFLSVTGDPGGQDAEDMVWIYER